MTELLAEREALLVECVKDFAADLQLVDPSDLIAYVRLERYANLNDLIQSSMELFFKPDTFKFGYGGECFVNWAERPRVSLDMEFVHPSVSLQFRLLLEDRICGVSIDRIVYANSDGDVVGNTRLLESALKDSLI